MPKKKYDHLHRYKKIKRGKQTIYRCMMPGCTHFIDSSLAENALIACNRCNEPFILTKDKMDLARPHCDACTRKRDTKKEETIAALAELFK